MSAWIYSMFQISCTELQGVILLVILSKKLVQTYACRKIHMFCPTVHMFYHTVHMFYYTVHMFIVLYTCFIIVYVYFIILYT